MQIVKSNGSLIEKVIRDKNGKLGRATFYVYQTAGKIKARLVNFTYIEELAGKVLSLVNPLSKRLFDSGILSRFSKLISYFLFTNYYFLGTKARAPTF